MAPRAALDRGSSRRQTGLQKLLGVAKGVLQQAENGREPLLTSFDLGAAARAARDHVQQLVLRPNDLEALWANPNRDTSAYLALFFLALRCSAPCHASEGPEFSYASLRDCFSAQISLYNDLIEDATWRSFCYRLLGPALLRTDALQCYSRLLAQVAKQLKPAAAAALPTTHRRAAAFRPPAGSAHAAAVLAEAGGPSRGHSGQGEQHDSPRSQPPSLADLDPLLRSVLQLVRVIVTGVLACTVDERATGPCPVGHPMSTARAQLQSSWVLEHWAQVLLVGSAAATGSGRSREKLADQGRQAELLSGLCHQLSRTSHLPFADFLRRPCGCALAATHMARLCAALDGGDAFGAAKLEVLVLPAFVIDEQTVTAFAENAALAHDASLALAGRAMSVHAAVVIVEAWAALLAEVLADGPHAAANSAAAGGEATVEALGGTDAGAGGEQGGGDGPGVEQGPAAGHTEAAGVNLCRLPPYNRGATVHLCLRLAKGLLASWGAPLQGVTLNTCIRGPNRITPVLPPTSTSVLLHQALACARLALLPAVWGRERVPRRTREQLHAWWEMYVAAAQHPEALTIAVPEPLKYPAWTCMKPKGVAARPSADAAAAIAAGLLPCMTWMVNRLGASGNIGAAWRPPDSFPGVRSCWRDVYQFGPLEQVGELVSAVGRRLRVAVEELRAFAAAMEGGKDWRRGHRGGDLLAEALRETMSLARTCLFDMHIAMVYSGGVAGSAGVAAEAAGEAEAGESADAAWCKQRALRSSFALAELLPPLSRGVQLCAGLLPLTRRLEGQAHKAAEQGGAAAEVDAIGGGLRSLIDCSYGCASIASLCCITVMTWYGGTAAGDWKLAGRSGGGGSSGSSGGGSSGGYAGGSGSSGGSNSGDSRSSGGGRTDSGGGSSGAPCAFDPAWRQLLLRDVRLMELLGAGVALQREADGQEIQSGDEPTGNALAVHLAHALTLAAANFPGELRAAVVGGGGAEAAEWGRVAGAAGGGSDSGPSGSSACASRPCISLPAVRAVMGGKGASAAEYSAELELVAGVLGDSGMRMGAERQLSDLARAFRLTYMMKPGVPRYLDLLVPPEEARAALAAAAASCGPTAQ